MKLGDLVHLYGYHPHNSDLANKIIHTGMFIEWERDEPDGGWIVLVDGNPQTFTKTWWKCKLVNNEQENV